MKLTTSLLLVFFFYSLALSQQVLHYGDNITARISEYGEVDYYQFEANMGDIIWLRMRDVTLVDAYIKIYDPNGNLVKEDWDDGGLSSIKRFKT